MKILEFLHDGNGAFSSKRLFALVSGALVVAAAIGNMWFGVKIEEFIFDGLMLMAVGGIGTVATENVAQSFFNRARSNGGDSSFFNFAENQNVDTPLIGREE